MSILDKEFDAVVLAKLNKKLAKAAEVMKEVNELREKLGVNSLIFSTWDRDEVRRQVRNELDEDESISSDQELYDRIDEKIDAAQALYDQIKVSDLENEMNDAGWSTSSSYC